VKEGYIKKLQNYLDKPKKPAKRLKTIAQKAAKTRWSKKA